MLNPLPIREQVSASDIARQIARLKREYEALDKANDDLEGVEKYKIDRRIQSVAGEIEVAEAMLSTCHPVTLKDVLIMVAAIASRFDTIGLVDVEAEPGLAFDRDCQIIERTFSRIIPALESFAGVTLNELGLDYCAAIAESGDAT